MALALVVLLAALTSVPFFKWLGLGSILGYLVAGFVLGPAALGFFDDYEGIMHFAEFGVVMLLFLIGLELKPARLWNMRQAILGFGALQVLITTLILFLGVFFLGRLNAKPSFVIALALSLSSTAFAIGLLTEKGYINTQFGRSSFAVLLFQDIAAIPLLAFIPFLTRKDVDFGWNQITYFVEIVFVIVLMVIGGRYGLKYFFRAVAKSRTREIFTAASLFVVLGSGFVMYKMQLSMALGAFIAGLLLSDSEYRHQLESDLESFKGLLLGLFFMSIGMSLNLTVVWAHLFPFTLSVLGFLFVKGAVVYFLARKHQLGDVASRNMAIILCQGGEFAFVVFAAGKQFGLLEGETTSFLIAMVTVSMPISAIILFLNEKYAPFSKKIEAPHYDAINEENPVIIAGFGRFGQIPGRILRVLGIGFTALEHDPDQVEVIRRFGNKIYYGDASRLDLLESANVAKAKLFILAIDDMEASIRVAQIVRQHFPQVKILARARNRDHVFRLMELGITDIWRETLSSSLGLSKQLLLDLGFKKQSAIKAIEVFRDHDQDLLHEQYRLRNDEKSLVSASAAAMKQLSELLQEDVERTVSNLGPEKVETPVEESTL